MHDADGNLCVSYLYDAWGNLLSAKTYTNAGTTARSLNSLLYRGYYFDSESGFYYLQSRYYDPQVRRFINADSILNQGSVLGNNMFAYCSNNPVNLSDETGYLPEWIKNAIKKVAKNIVKPVIDTSQKVFSKINYTYSTGTSVSFSPGFWAFSVQLGLSIDTKGNIAIQVTGGGGVTIGTPCTTIGKYKSYTNAPSINELNGPAYQIGGSAIIPVEGFPVAVGADYSIIPDNERGRIYNGFTSTVGIGFGAPGGEFHTTWSKTGTWNATRFNVYDAFKKLYDNIMGW